MKDIILKPKLSEKAYSLSKDTNTYTFEVPAASNKHTLARAIKQQYGVEAIKVRVARVAAKPIRTYSRKRRAFNKSTRSGFVKGYVTLKEGDSLPLFAAVDDEKAAVKKRETK